LLLDAADAEQVGDDGTERIVMGPKPPAPENAVERKDAIAIAHRLLGSPLDALNGLALHEIRRAVIEHAVHGLHLDEQQRESEHFIGGAWRVLRPSLERRLPHLQHHEDSMHKDDFPSLTHRQRFALRMSAASLLDPQERADALDMRLLRMQPIRATLPALRSVRPEQQPRRDSASLSPRQRLLEANRRATYDNDFSGYDPR
jgi:hypothetical protein